jgi:hypothetical protein
MAWSRAAISLRDRVLSVSDAERTQSGEDGVGIDLKHCVDSRARPAVGAPEPKELLKALNRAAKVAFAGRVTRRLSSNSEILFTANS